MVEWWLGSGSIILFLANTN